MEEEMKRLTLEQKALRVIDSLVSDDVNEIWDIKSAFNHMLTQEDAKLMADKLSKIYTISHSSIPEHSCFAVHDSWRKETLSLFRKLKRGRLIPSYSGAMK